MQGEIDTYPIISKCLELGKVVYIPKVVGKQAEDMRMFHLQTFDQIGTFPKNKWGIPEPSISMINLEDETYLESIDVVFVPGVAFDSRCGRVGHGKGYYGRFLKLNFEFPLIWYFKIAF
jgi:5-formyltetrahydrofolate cyclo-ligase